MPHLHICASGAANSEANDERTNHIFASSFIASFASPFVALALEAVYRTRVKGNKWRFMLCVWTCECSYTCENSSFAQRQNHTNVCASGGARHEHEYVNAVLELRKQMSKIKQICTIVEQASSPSLDGYVENSNIFSTRFKYIWPFLMDFVYFHSIYRVFNKNRYSDFNIV